MFCFPLVSPYYIHCNTDTDLGPDLEHVFEAHTRVGQATLEHHDHVIVVLVDLLALPAGTPPARSLLLQLCNLDIDRSDVLLDDIRQLGYFDWPVVKERLAPGNCIIPTSALHTRNIKAWPHAVRASRVCPSSLQSPFQSPPPAAQTRSDPSYPATMRAQARQSVVG
jgi:hypothetical protein